MQGSHADGRAPAQTELMERFLAAIQEMSPQEAEAATGISWMSITNYRKGEWRRLTARVQREMRLFLKRRPPDASPAWDEGYRAAVEDMERVLARMKAEPTSALPGSGREESPDDSRKAHGALAAVEDATNRAGKSRRRKVVDRG